MAASGGTSPDLQKDSEVYSQSVKIQLEVRHISSLLLLMLSLPESGLCRPGIRDRRMG